MKTVSAEVSFKVEFYDVDSMFVVYHGNYAKYFEKARWALFETIDYTYEDMKRDGCAFPVTSMSAKFIKPLRFGDRARVRAVLEEYENCLKIAFEIFNAETNEVTTKGKTTQMAFDMFKGESVFVCPPHLVEKVKAFLARLPDE
ncbi:MAG: acyl-CoA thioesterase [Treponema sp.]|jgi:acyl-CoA thioester hydrolase|nr:acyl-CoA thioesterase [Treponema sp.]